MGLFCTSIHLKTDNREAVADALQDGPASAVLEPQGGWVSVYADGLLEHEDGPSQLAASLSLHLGVESISFSVHDSDIARYWLHRSGELIDEYNSWPGYFAGEEPRPIGGDAEALARLCAAEYGVRDLRRILAADQVFADDLVVQLAALLGISAERVTSDYRDVVGAAEGHDLQAALAQASRQLQTKPHTDYDPNAIAMVRAAALGDLEGLTELLHAGASLGDPAPGPIPGDPAIAGGAEAIQPEMTPLIAAIVNYQHEMAEALLDLGVDPNDVHPRYGSAVHVAAGMGSPDLLELLLSRGGEPDTPGVQQQSPAEALAAGRQAYSMITESLELMNSLGLDSSTLDQMSPHRPTDSDWDRCEALLRAKEADR